MKWIHFLTIHIHFQFAECHSITLDNLLIRITSPPLATFRRERNAARVKKRAIEARKKLRCACNFMLIGVRPRMEIDAFAVGRHGVEGWMCPAWQCAGEVVSR